MVIERTFATFASNTRQTATRISANGPLFTYAYQRMDRINRTNPNKREYCFILYEIERRTDHSYHRTDFCSFDAHPWSVANLAWLSRVSLCLLSLLKYLALAKTRNA